MLLTLLIHNVVMTAVLVKAMSSVRLLRGSSWVVVMHHLVVWTLLVIVRRHRMLENFVETIISLRLLVSLVRLLHSVNQPIVTVR